MYVYIYNMYMYVCIYIYILYIYIRYELNTIGTRINSIPVKLSRSPVF